MKKYKLVLFAFSLFILFGINCNASSNTLPRTTNNLLLPKDVVVTDSNLQDILNTPAVDSSEKVYDFADILSVPEEEKILKAIKKYIKDSKYDSVVVTTNNLNGYQINDYAYNFYDYNDFKDNGLIFVIYVNDVDPVIFMTTNSISTDSELYKMYNKDDRVNQTLAYVYKDVKQKEYYSAVDKYLSVIQGFYDLEKKTEGSSAGYEVSTDGKIVKNIPWIEIVVLSVALSFVVVVILLYRLKGKNIVQNKINLDENIDKTTLIVKCEKDELVDTSLSHDK